MKLTDLKTGEKAKVLNIEGGIGIKNKLQAMGIFPGIDITVIQQMNRGPVIVEAGNTRLAIGRGMAERVEVKTNG
jgi:ferrous iron transport protein A